MFRNEPHNAVSPCSYTLIAKISFTRAPFAPWATITVWFQVLFIFGEEFFSTFRHRTSFAIGHGLCLDLEIDDPHIPTPESGNGTLPPESIFLPSLTGLSPSMAPVFHGTSGRKKDCTWPHISFCLHKKIRVGLCRFRSLLIAASRLIFFPPLIKML